MFRKYSDGIIEVIAGPMFSGKSEELIKIIRTLEIGKIKILVVKPFFDTRFSSDEIVSRGGYKIKTVSAANAQDIKKHFDKSYQAIAIDEAQFFNEDLIELVETLASEGKRVILSGLDTDFNRKPFGIMPQLLAIADNVIKLKAVCMRCQNAATNTFRKTLDENLKVLGDTDEYEARCRKCHIQGQIEKLNKKNGASDENRTRE